jgi:transposase-like protein
MPEETPALWSQAWWQQTLRYRQQGRGWKTVCEQDLQMKYSGTFTRRLKEARLLGWIPAEQDLPPAIRSDGKRVGLVKSKHATAQKSPTPEATTTDADTPAGVRYGAVNEFDALPEGYAKEIQPMRKYTEAEEWALDKSMELHGFQGAIVRDQYGRILDGHHRQRLARLRGFGVPFTTTHVRDDAHAIEIARALNINRRHYSQEEREELAILMRDQGFSYRAIADALKVGVSTVYRDVFGVLRERQETNRESAGVPDETPEPTLPETRVPHETPDAARTESGVPDETPPAKTTDAPVPHGTPAPEKRIRGLDGKTYADRRPTTPAGNGVKVSAQDRQLAKVIELLLQHANGWDAKHWEALLQTISSLRPTSHTSAV